MPPDLISKALGIISAVPTEIMNALTQRGNQQPLVSPQPRGMTTDQAAQQMAQYGWRDASSQPTPSPTPGNSTPQGPAQLPQSSTTSLGRNPDIGKYNISPDVHSAIQGAAKEFGVPKNLLYDIAGSEGGFNPNAANTTPEGQSAGIPVGLYQFKKGTWDHDLANYAAMKNTSLTNWNNPDRTDPVQNARGAAYLIKNGQLGRWDASKPNWGRFYSDKELESYYSQTPGRNK